MDLIIANNSVPLGTADAPPTEGTPQYATSGTPGGQAPTQFPAYHYNSLMQELTALITGAGIGLSRFVVTQILQAVKRIAGGNKSAFTANATLTADNAGLVTVNASAGNVVLTLPPCAAANGLPLTFNVVRTDSSANTVSLVAQGTDTFNPGLPAGGVAITQNSPAVVVGDGVSVWNRMHGLTSPAWTQPRKLYAEIDTASANLTFTADEISVETALGGTMYVLPSFNQALNTGTVGLNGMDTGLAPSNGFVAIYAIFNPATGVAGLLGTAITASALAPPCYGGGSAPAGFIASSLLAVWPTNSGRNLIPGLLRDRKFKMSNSEVTGAALAAASSPTLLSMAALIPANAVRFSGLFLLSNSGGYPTAINLYARPTVLIYGKQMSLSVTGVAFTRQDDFSDQEISVSTPQQICYTATSSGGTATFEIFVTGYEI